MKAKKYKRLQSDKYRWEKYNKPKPNSLSIFLCTHCVQSYQGVRDTFPFLRPRPTLLRRLTVVGGAKETKSELSFNLWSPHALHCSIAPILRVGVSDTSHVMWINYDPQTASTINRRSSENVYLKRNNKNSDKQTFIFPFVINLKSLHNVVGWIGLYITLYFTLIINCRHICFTYLITFADKNYFYMQEKKLNPWQKRSIWGASVWGDFYFPQGTFVFPHIASKRTFLFQLKLLYQFNSYPSSQRVRNDPDQ